MCILGDLFYHANILKHALIVFISFPLQILKLALFYAKARFSVESRAQPVVLQQ